MAFVWGWLCGTVFFLVLLRWLNYTFQTFSAIPWPLTWGPTLLLSAYCGLYTAVVCGLIAWLAGRRSIAWALASAPFLWVGGEWLRGHLLGGFPWGTLGYSQHLRLPVIQIAELGGVHAVSLVLVAVNAALTGVFLLGWRSAVSGLALGGALLGATLGFGRLAARRAAAAGRGAGGDHAAVDRAAPQVRPRPRHASSSRSTSELTRQAGAERPALIVWPETALPTRAPARPRPAPDARHLSGEMRVPLLVGLHRRGGRASEPLHQHRVPRDRPGYRGSV